MQRSLQADKFSKEWNFQKIFSIQLVIAFALCTFFSPLTHHFWEAVDIFIFKTINSTLAWGHGWQTFWAMANHKMADWIEDVVILAFAVIYVRSGQKEERLYRSSQILFFVIYSAFIIFFVNKTLIRDYLSINRDSPSLIVRETIKLSEHISWLKIKDESHKSFPGDHATTALLFGSTFIYLGSKKMKICAGIYMVFLILPRMILGAHWFSDVVVGSGSIVFFFLAWAYLSPLAYIISKGFARFFSLFSFSKKTDQIPSAS
ncbi:MAG: phosphatase PAP2 family protein [Chlamydiae bacterium]|nr:phosphatase PAP2 family protein [Chlamydiota bacterium]